MRIRKKCVREGHQWDTWTVPILLPFEFCARWFCDGERVNPKYPMDNELRAVLESTLAKKMREDNRKK